MQHSGLKMKEIRKILEKRKIKASAPCRIDSGGTWDIKAMAISFEKIKPTTVNIALDLRTYVEILPFEEGKIKISSEGFETEVFSYSNIRFDSPYGIFLSAIRHFGFHGIEVRISSEFPPQSALGGSSTALVALIKALSKIKKLLDGKSLSKRQILHLSYHIEDAISGGNCGAQDQGAGIYGGVNQWIWTYSRPYFCKRIKLLDKTDLDELSERILVAYSGIRHQSSSINRSWIEDFLSGKTQKGWIKVNEVVHRFADSLKRKDWSEAIRWLNEEVAIRKEITPSAFIPVTEKLIDDAVRLRCGARFSGAGAGGSVWAIGEPENIRKLKETWKDTLSSVKDARIFECRVDGKGLV